MNPPANWYPDPTGRHGQRYWDGQQWTEHVFTDGVQSVDPLDAVTGQAGTDAADGSSAATVEDASGEASSDAAPPALPRRQRPEPAAPSPETGGLDEPVAAAEGLFDDAGDAEPTPAPAGDPWTPEEAADDVGPAVAPEVEPEDVATTVEEVADAAEPDFSDAFVLAPETASRLVGRSEPADEAPPTEEQPPTDEQPQEDVQPPTGEQPQEGDAGPDDVSVPSDDASPVEAEAPAADEDEAPVAAATDEEETPDDHADDAPVSADAALIDAPPPSMPAPTAATAATGTDGLGITGDLVGGAFAERESGGAVALQNARMLRCAANSGIVARQGTMVAYQGDVQFERQGAGGVGRALKRAATGEGLAMMRVTGNGDVFFADGGQHVFLLHLDGGQGLSVNGRNVLAFSASLKWDIERVKGATLLAGGLFNTTLTGTGWVALVADGEPVVLRTDEAPTYVDVNALVAWSGGLSTRIVNTVSAKSLVGLGSGEAFQMAFDGAGIVIVQPSEGPMGGAAAT